MRIHPCYCIMLDLYANFFTCYKNYSFVININKGKILCSFTLWNKFKNIFREIPFLIFQFFIRRHSNKYSLRGFDLVFQ